MIAFLGLVVGAVLLGMVIWGGALGVQTISKRKQQKKSEE